MSLIEVLVSLAILAGGLVGAMALQSTTKKSSFDAQQRSLASSLAQDIIERIRVNEASNNFLEVYEGDYGDGSLAVPSNRCNNPAAPCSPIALATNDLYEWEQKLIGTQATKGEHNVGGLVNPVGCIVHTDNNLSVIISWEGRMATRDGADDVVAGAADCGEASATRRQVALEVFVY